MLTLLFAAVLLTPPPRHLEWIAENFALPEPLTVSAATDEERQVAHVLAGELKRLYRVGANVTAGASAGAIQLALSTTPRGQALLKGLRGAALYAEKKGPETYLLEAGPAGVTIVAETARGLLYGVQTLLQLVRKSSTGSQVVGVRVVDYPDLGFRGLHICVFPNTELAAVRQAMLVAARYKYNAVVIEFWSSLQSARRPETAYEHAYTPTQVKPLIELGRALHLEMIPMLNSWGHASGMRARSALHVVLDRFPQFRPLYEEDGWSFCLTNPALYEHLFDRYAELLELFGQPRWFHLGLDEAWGHRGLLSSKRCRGDTPPTTLAKHVKRLYDYFAVRRIQVFVWHDMFIQRDHPQLGRVSPANSVPPFNSHLALEELPKDVVIAAWNYDETREWPVPKFFQDRGFRVVVCPWKSRRNAVMLLNVAKKHRLMGLLQTTWDSLDVALPTVAEAGMMAWAGPDFQLDSVPFDNILGALRAFPICDLPRYETTLGRDDR